MLSVRNVSAGYGPIEVVRSVNMEVSAGECVALIGWSGSGKTTLLKTVVGLLPASAGEIFYDGENITTVAAHLRVEKGIVMVPEGRHLFTGMSVFENILVGAHTVSSRADLERQAKYVFGLFPVLKARRDQIAGTLSGGEQQMCAIARALMSAPRLLIIDELSLGLAPVVVSHLAEAIIEIRKLGTTIVLVEQDAELATSITDKAYVIKRGQIATAAISASLKNDADIRRDYLWKAGSR